MGACRSWCRVLRYEWYWRVEPGVRFFCDITYDPFLYMEKYNKKYGFVVTLLELRDTIPTLWKTVEEYAKSRRIDISENSKLLFPYFRDKNSGDFNLCHFWSNFEIASLNLWRTPQYRDFFNYLDQTGNFFYERWGDAPGLYLDVWVCFNLLTVYVSFGICSSLSSGRLVFADGRSALFWGYWISAWSL